MKRYTCLEASPSSPIGIAICENLPAAGVPPKPPVGKLNPVPVAGAEPPAAAAGVAATHQRFEMNTTKRQILKIL